MSIIIDVSLLIILAVFAVIGWKKGFIKSLCGFLSYVISFAFANALYRILSSLIIRLPFMQAMISDVTMPPVAENATFLDKVSVAFRYVAENAKLSSLDASATEAKKILDNYIVEAIADILGFIVIFFVMLLLFKLLLWLLNKVVTKTPVIKQANSLLGSLLGLGKGFVWTWALTNLFVRFILPFLTEKYPTVFVSDIANSFAVKLCTKINPITYLFLLINMLTNGK